MLSILVLPCLLGVALSAPVSDDAPEIQAVQNIVSYTDQYLKDHLQTEFKLPNIGGYLPTDIVKLTDGKLGEFDSLEIQGSPEIVKQQNSDGSHTYSYDVSLGLKQLNFHYQFQVKVIGLQIRKGSVDISPKQNSVRAKGLVVVKKDGSCDAALRSLTAAKFGNYQITIQPNDIPQLQSISEIIFNYVSPKMTPVTNVALEGLILLPGFQHKFSEMVCEALSQKPTTKAPTKAPAEAPTEAPTKAPTEAPTKAPTEAPSEAPTEAPTEASTEAPQQ